MGIKLERLLELASSVGDLIVEKIQNASVDIGVGQEWIKRNGTLDELQCRSMRSTPHPFSERQLGIRRRAVVLRELLPERVGSRLRLIGEELQCRQPLMGLQPSWSLLQKDLVISNRIGEFAECFQRQPKTITDIVA